MKLKSYSVEEKESDNLKDNKNEFTKKFILKFAIFIILVLLIIALLLFGITQIYTNKIRTNYLYALNLKYYNLKEQTSPKIIVVGGSSASFGINAGILEKRTDMNVANLGLHASLGPIFQTEISKANIQSGDIIILVYEFNNYAENKPDPELLTIGIDNNIEIYKYLNYEYVKQLIKYIPTYILKKIDKTSEQVTNGIYSIDSFDKKGNMILDRENCILPYPVPIKTYGKVNLKQISLTEEMAKYINDFYDYCNSKGAQVVFSFPPVLDEVFEATDEEIDNLQKMISKKIKPTVISNIKDYVFSREYMYDTIYHCNNEGEKIRSEKLANDINNYLKNMEV